MYDGCLGNRPSIKRVIEDCSLGRGRIIKFTILAFRKQSAVGKDSQRLNSRPDGEPPVAACSRPGTTQTTRSLRAVISRASGQARTAVVVLIHWENGSPHAKIVRVSGDLNRTESADRLAETGNSPVGEHAIP